MKGLVGKGKGKRMEGIMGMKLWVRMEGGVRRWE